MGVIGCTTSEYYPLSRAKQVDVCLVFIPYPVHKSSLNVVHVSTDCNDLEILTNPVGYAIFRKALNRIGLGALDFNEC